MLRNGYQFKIISCAFNLLSLTAIEAENTFKVYQVDLKNELSTLALMDTN